MNHFSITTLIALCSLTVHAEQYKFTAPQISISLNEQKQIHPVESIGEAVFQEGMRVPAYAISVPTGVDEEDDQYHAPTADCRKVKCYFDMKIDSKLAAEMRVYNITETNEWILAPASWTRWQAGIGANGTIAFTMADATGKSSLSFYASPVCYGCALGAASIYFPTAAKEFKKEFETDYNSTNVPLQRVQKNANTVLFQYQLPQQYKTNGVAKYNPNTDDLFQSLKVTVPPKDEILARTMLNFFLFTHKN